MSNRAKDLIRCRFICFLLGATVEISTSWAAPQKALDPSSRPVRMHVHVYDYAPTPAKVLAGAEEQVDMILLSAGVEVTWELSSPPKDPSKAKSAMPRPPDVACVELRIVPRFDSMAG